MTALAPVRTLVNAIRSKRFEQRLSTVNRRCVEVYGLRVVQGPFGGLVYTKEAAGSEFAPKLLGTYESELQGPVAELIAGKPRLIVDIGAEKATMRWVWRIAAGRRRCWPSR